MKIAVKKDQAAQRIAHTSWTTTMVNRDVITPAMRDIADKIIETLKKEFDGPIKYAGTMAGGFSTVDVNASTIGIAQSARHEKFIREGTAGPYKGFPWPVVTWATVKLGKTKREGFAIAKSIQAHGTAKTFVPLHPAGEPRFEYAEWAVEVKHKRDLDKWSKSIGGALVTYITKGDAWVTM